MFGFFKRKKKEDEPKAKPAPQMMDINGSPLEEGDKVEALRYDLGKCQIIRKDDGHYYYESLETGKQVIWVKMIDASTDMQKVKKLGF